MITFNNASVQIYLTDSGGAESFRHIDSDNIFSLSMTDVTYALGQSTENGVLEFECYYSDLSELEYLFFAYTNIYATISFTSEDGERLTLSKRFYLTEYEPIYTYGFHTVKIKGIDLIGLLDDIEISTVNNTLDGVIMAINEKIASIKSYYNTIKYNIKVEISDELKTYISNNGIYPNSVTVSNNAREVIRQISEAFNAIAYCRGNTIYIDKYFYADIGGSGGVKPDKAKLNNDTIVKDTLQIENERAYTGINIDIVGGSAYKEGNEINVFEIKENPFIQSNAQAKLIARVLRSIYRFDGTANNVSFKSATMETHGFELVSDTYYDLKAVYATLGDFGSGYVALLSRTFNFESGDNSYVIKVMNGGDMVYIAGEGGGTS